MPPRPILTHGPAPSPPPSETGARPVVLVAPNAFKGTLTPAEAARAMRAGLARAWPTADPVLVPVADGGDGSLEAFAAAGFALEEVPARGPTGLAATAALGRRGPVVVVELAGACGLGRLPGGVPAPMTSSTLGLGDVLRAALDTAPDRVVVCLGGSASTDGGAGLLVALGARLVDDGGRTVDPCGANLARVAAIDLHDLHPRLRDTEVTVAVDVTAPLDGPEGAAHVFASQKGASPEEVRALDASLRSWAHVLAHATGREVGALPGAGAAGGTAAALAAVCGARLVSGAELIMDTVGLPGLLTGARLVLTGEGRLDEQSALGKGAVMVAQRALAAGVPVLAVCGRVDLAPASMHHQGFAAWADCGEVTAGSAEQEVAAATALAVERWGAAG